MHKKMDNINILKIIITFLYSCYLFSFKQLASQTVNILKLHTVEWSMFKSNIGKIDYFVNRYQWVQSWSLNEIFSNEL